MKKKNALIIVAILVVIVLFAGLIIPMLSKEKTGDNTNDNSETASITDTEAQGQESAQQTTDKETSVKETKKDQESEESEDIEGGGSSGAGSSSEGNAGGSGGSGGTPENTETETSDSQPESKSQASEGSSGGGSSSIPEISFPYTISESNLVVEQIRSYDGYFIEDGSDTEVKGVAAIVVTNNGGDLEFAGIGISQGSRSLGFSASQIPAGATVIIQEQNGAAFSSDPYYSATATTQPAEKFEMSEELVEVKDNGNGSLSVTNLTDKKLSKIRVFFKNYLPDEDIYVGGITYTITLNDLEPGTAMEVSASHYDSKYSVVVEVLAE